LKPIYLWSNSILIELLVVDTFADDAVEELSSSSSTIISAYSFYYLTIRASN